MRPPPQRHRRDSPARPGKCVRPRPSAAIIPTSLALSKTRSFPLRDQRQLLAARSALRLTSPVTQESTLVEIDVQAHRRVVRRRR